MGASSSAHNCGVGKACMSQQVFSGLYLGFVNYFYLALKASGLTSNYGKLVQVSFVVRAFELKPEPDPAQA